MQYQIKAIKSKQEILLCNTFSINQYTWGGAYRPRTYGKLGYIEGKGLFVKFFCEEANPTRKNTMPNSPVYQDSAVEAFFSFSPKRDANGRLTYTNFEINANAAMLVGHGSKYSQERDFLSEQLRTQIECTAEISDKEWSAKLFIPKTVITSLYPDFTLCTGAHFTCNFYKIQESHDACEHFASYAEIHTAKPDFHLPEFFADAVIL